MALWVLFGHWGAAIYLQIPHVPANFGNILAVDVFIILSGFAIATLIDRKSEPYRLYISRRILRIFPVYWFYLAISTLLAPISIQVWSMAAGGEARESRQTIAVEAVNHYWENLATHIPALHGIMPAKLIPLGEFAFLGQAWSISLEWQFYLIAPFAIAALLAATRKLTAALALAAVLLFLAVISRYFPAGFIGGYSVMFMIGIGTHYLLKWHGEKPRLGADAVAALAVIAILVAVLLRVHSAIAIAIWIAVVAGVLSYRTGIFGMVSKILSSPLIVAFGKMSYSVYLSHMIALTLGMLVLEKAGISSPLPHAVLLLIITLCGTTAMSLFSYFRIEVPFQSLGKRLAAPVKDVTA